MTAETRPLFQIWPELEPQLGFLAIGDFPTPIERFDRVVQAAAGIEGETYVKRDDLSSAVYGGNKVRTLEALFGQARREGKLGVVATGAYGSNHAVATVLHARRAGFRSAVALFPQPHSETAVANLRVSVTHADEVTDLLHWSALPYAIWQRTRQASRQPPGALVMPPGGAIPRGCLGFMSAGLELAQQVERGLMPPPDEIVIALGSTCSTAGLLMGLRLAQRLGIGWGRARARLPELIAVRVTPWPVTSAFRILRLARRVSRWLHTLSGDAVFDVSRAELEQGLFVDGSQLGAGYGRPSAAGLAAIEALHPFSRALDTTYSAKSAAALLERVRRSAALSLVVSSGVGRGPLAAAAGAAPVRLFWSTKSSAPLPEVSEAALAAGPPRMLHWLTRGAASSAR
jgi:D-cysteine desulfhydrase